MEKISERIMKHVGYDNSSFNIEYFWDEIVDRIWLLEINTRISQSHSLLFEKVDGVSNQQLSIDLALGRRPDMPRRQGDSPLAAKFFHRLFQGNARVARVPTPEEIAGLEAKLPGTRILPQIKPGMWLSELPEQDSYSYAIAYVYLGAKNQSNLLSKYDRVIKNLKFRFEQFDETLPRVEAESEPPA